MPDLADSLRNHLLEQYEAHIGPSPSIRFYEGTKPANAADAATGTLLATILAPPNWMADAANGSKGLLGIWTDVVDADGTIGYFRVVSSGGTVMDQGTVTATGQGGTITVDNPAVVTGQTLNITAFNKTI